MKNTSGQMSQKDKVLPWDNMTQLMGKMKFKITQDQMLRRDETYVVFI
jgi:hypothetical protein